MEKILSLIPIDERKEFDESLIEGLYIKFQSSEIDDKKASIKLRDMIAGREVLILGPGLSIIREKELISAMTCERFVVTTNFITNEYESDALFISNEKRLSDAPK